MTSVHNTLFWKTVKMLGKLWHSKSLLESQQCTCKRQRHMGRQDREKQNKEILTLIDWTLDLINGPCRSAAGRPTCQWEEPRIISKLWVNEWYSPESGKPSTTIMKYVSEALTGQLICEISSLAVLGVIFFFWYRVSQIHVMDSTFYNSSRINCFKPSKIQDTLFLSW